MLRRSTYSPLDDSVNGVMMIALQNFKVKHIVVTVSGDLLCLPPIFFACCDHETMRGMSSRETAPQFS